MGSPPSDVDVLVPTRDRPAALAATLATLLGQTHRSFRVVVSDQGRVPATAAPEVRAAVGVLGRSHPVEVHRHLPRRGIAEHRQSLLDRATAPTALFLDDDVLCEPDLLRRLRGALGDQGCGFVGSFVNAPGALDPSSPRHEPPPTARIELWDGPVLPEVVGPGLEGWDRRHLHSNSYPLVLAERLGLDGDRLYKVAWIGACVLYDTAKLREVGGFGFWTDLPPEHAGEEALAQLRLMARYGGAGLLPSGAWHQEVPTTIPNRTVDAPYVLSA